MKLHLCAADCIALVMEARSMHGRAAAPCGSPCVRLPFALALSCCSTTLGGMLLCRTFGSGGQDRNVDQGYCHVSIPRLHFRWDLDTRPQQRSLPLASPDAAPAELGSALEGYLVSPNDPEFDAKAVQLQVDAAVP